MNKEKKTYVEPNMRVMEVETEAMMAGSGSCSNPGEGGVYTAPSGCTTDCSDNLAKPNTDYSPGDNSTTWSD